MTREPQAPADLGTETPSSVRQVRQFSCRQCGAALQIPETARATVCPYCDVASIVERPPTIDRPAPTFVVGFVIAEDDAKGRAQRWLQSQWFAPAALKKAAIERVRGVYLPAYLYGATAHANYLVEIGQNYTASETYVDPKGRTKTRSITKTEWSMLSGRYSRYIMDRLVTASRGLANKDLEAIEPYDFNAIARYAPALLAGWIAEDPSLTRAACLELARREGRMIMRQRLAEDMPGDHHRNLRFELELEREHLDVLMVPLWLFTARYAAEQDPVRILVNGQTGKVAGQAPRSTTKIVLTILAVTVFVAVVLYGIAR